MALLLHQANCYSDVQGYLYLIHLRPPKALLRYEAYSMQHLKRIEGQFLRMAQLPSLYEVDAPLWA